MDEKISVIIPVYNMEKYISRCLESVLNNTYQDLEIICVNDGSTDRSAEILYAFQKKDTRVVICTQDNRGISAARNKGVSLATSNYVAFVDADDWIHPQYFEFLLKAIIENDADIAMCNHIQTREYKKLDAEYSRYQISEKIQGIDLLQSHRTKSYVWAKLYKKDIIKNNNWFNEEIRGGEDALFNTVMICNNKALSVICIAENLYFYYEREQSLKSKIKSCEYIYLCKIYDDLKKGLSDDRYVEALDLEIFKRALVARYYESVLKENKNNFLASKLYLKMSYRRLIKSKAISNRKKFIYFIFKVSPLAYRIFRILSDPTMLDWERNCKEIRKKASCIL